MVLSTQNEWYLTVTCIQVLDMVKTLFSDSQIRGLRFDSQACMITVLGEGVVYLWFSSILRRGVSDSTLRIKQEPKSYFFWLSEFEE